MSNRRSGQFARQVPTCLAICVVFACKSLLAQRNFESPNLLQRPSVVTKSAQFKYLTRQARGRAATELARVQLHLDEEMEVHIRASTSATSLSSGTTNFAMGFSHNGLPADMEALGWPESGRFVTIANQRQWVFCGSTFVTTLKPGDHAICWCVGDIVGGDVLFDAGSMSVQAFPLVEPGQRTKKLGLLVGINNYLSPTVPDLAGCINDVEDMYDLLIDRFEFDENDIHILTDADATHDNIIREIQEHLIANASQDILVVFYYSGHGSQARDEVGGDEQLDGWDETIVPYDSRMPGKYDITDDKIHGLLTQLSRKTNNITFVFDSCHSGTVARMVGGTVRRTARNKNFGAVARRTREDTRVQPPAPGYARGVQGLIGNKNLQYVLLSGCQAHELSHEHDVQGRRRGAFTYHFSRAIRRSPSSDITYRDIMDQVIANVSSEFRSQHPQIEGANIDDHVFRVKARAAPPYYFATQLGKNVILNAGFAQGVTAGSVFDIYPLDSAALDDARQAIARVELTSIDGFWSAGKFLWGGPLAARALAVERRHTLQTQLLSVFIDLQGQTHEDAVRDSMILKEIKKRLVEPEQGQPRVQVVDDRAQARVFLSENHRGQIEISDGSFVLDRKPTADADVVIGVLTKLNRWSMWVNLLSFENPTTSLKTQLSVKQPVRTAARDHQSSGRSANRFLDGDAIQFSVKNESQRDLYVTLVNLSSDASIRVLYPPEGNSQLLKKGRSLTTEPPTTVFVPDGWTEIKDFVKLIATTQPSDFRFVEQDAAPRSADLGASLVSRSIIRPPGAPARAPVGGLHDWTTKTIVLDVVRPTPATP